MYTIRINVYGKETTNASQPQNFIHYPRMTQKDAAQTQANWKELVGWKPNVSFEEELKRTIMWFVPKKRSS